MSVENSNNTFLHACHSFGAMEFSRLSGKLGTILARCCQQTGGIESCEHSIEKIVLPEGILFLNLLSTYFKTVFCPVQTMSSKLKTVS